MRMKLGVKKLSTAVRLALSLGAVIAVGASGSAFAQDSPAQDASAQQAQTLKAVVVTGSRLPSVTITASSPVTTIDAQALTVTGTTSVDQLVNQLPQLSPYFDQFQNNGATGYPTADLRGLGTKRTLVLIDGQRVQPGIASSGAVDLSQVPSALVQRVDILTGGASAVYGADAVSGVVNFVLNHDFEGVQFDYKLSGYSHDNRNKYMQGLEAAKNYPFPTGNSGFEGKTKEADAIFGGHFADGDGHAMGWVSAQKTDAVMSDARDYSACSLNNAGTACGGSGTAANPNFFVFDHTGKNDEVHMDPSTGQWLKGAATAYNYAPSNYYQRPSTRINVGTSIQYHINDAFEPYMDAMYQHRRSEFQLAPSGTFFADDISVDCVKDAAVIGAFCNQVAPLLGLDASQPLTVEIGKRNVEGGPRRSAITNDSYRFVVGARGDINLNWSYDVSGVMGETTNQSVGTGDFLSDRIVPAVLGCPAGSYTGCMPYNLWQPNAVTPESVAGLGGVSFTQTRTRLMDINAFVRGDLGFALPWAGADNISAVFGTEWRKQDLNSTADSNQQHGNFAGAGGPTLPIAGQIQVKEAYTEFGIPIVSDMGMLKSLSADLGYRYSDYKNIGTTDTFKIGLNANLNDMFRLRGGFNRAVRAPNPNELFAVQQIGLFSGADPCAGPTPADSAAQCANTGVTATQYGHIPDSPASQYNEFTGGNQNLKPEKADTYTFGFAVTPLQGLEATLDYYDIKIKDTIGTIGASTILDLCAKTGNPFLCDNVKRNPLTGDIWLGQTGRVVNLTSNFGNQEARGIDLNASYVWRMFGGRAQVSMAGSRLLSLAKDPLPGVNDEAAYDCSGKINTSCIQPLTPKWRHLMNLNYSKDWWSVNVRWRYFGQMRYVNNDGSFATTDKLLFNHDHKISAYNWLDVSGTFKLGAHVDLTVGVNNITDRAPPLVGGTLVDNANTPGGYDELGRYYFTNVSVHF
jgi:outer membrane receptor protein involved in Fe transport